MTAIDPIDKALEETFPASDPPAVSAEPRRAAPTDDSLRASSTRQRWLHRTQRTDGEWGG